MWHIARYYFQGFIAFCVATAVFANSQLLALDKEQAIENCRASSGRPAYTACMQGGGTHEGCFGKARAIVQSCVRSAMAAAQPDRSEVALATLNELRRSIAGKRVDVDPD